MELRTQGGDKVGAMAELEQRYLKSKYNQYLEEYRSSLIMFVQETQSEDFLAIIIRGHLYIENALY